MSSRHHETFVDAASPDIKSSREINFRQLIESSPVATCVTDIYGNVSFYNHAAVDLWGRRPELGKDLWCGASKILKTDGSILAMEDHPAFVALREHRPGRNLEFIIEMPDGRRKNVLSNPDLLKDDAGKIVGTVNVFIDITDRKLLERQAEQRIRESEERLRLSDVLERTVTERTSALQKAKENLERSNQELEQFAYIASHDLQEPLRKIQTFSSLLSNHIDQSPEAQRYFDKINSSAQRMSVLIRDVLHYSRLSCSDDVFVETSLRAIVNSVVNDYELLILEKNAEVRVGYLPKVLGVTHQLHQLVANIIGNALKFSSKRPLIEIFSEPVLPEDVHAILGLKPAESYVRVVFRDNGIGFEQKFAEQIFTIFQRLNTRESYNGTGIGLAICKRIVESHGGVISAVGEVGKGATFNIILPALATS